MKNRKQKKLKLNVDSENINKFDQTLVRLTKKMIEETSYQHHE